MVDAAILGSEGRAVVLPQPALLPPSAGTAPQNAQGKAIANSSASGSGSVRAQTLVACGRPPPEVTVLLVDPATRRVIDPGRVGEVWVASGSVAAGYWGQADLTEVRTHGYAH